MGEQTGRRKRTSAEPVPCSAAPCCSHGEESETNGKVVVHEAHVKSVAVGKDKLKWRELPGRNAGCCRQKRKAPPEESEDRERGDDFLGDHKADEISNME